MGSGTDIDCRDSFLLFLQESRLGSDGAEAEGTNRFFSLALILKRFFAVIVRQRLYMLRNSCNAGLQRSRLRVFRSE